MPRLNNNGTHTQLPRASISADKNGFGDADGIDDYVDDFAGVGGLDAPSESDLPEDIPEAAGGVDVIEDEVYDEKFGESSIADSVPRSSKSQNNKGIVDKSSER